MSTDYLTALPLLNVAFPNVDDMIGIRPHHTDSAIVVVRRVYFE